MDRLSVPASALVAVALGACQSAPPRIYTDKDLAELEEQVMARIAQIKDCSRPQLAQLAHSAAPCKDAWDKLPAYKHRDLDTPGVRDIAQRCGPQLLADVMSAVGPTPSCSPFQVGIRAMADSDFPSFIATAQIFSWHAELEPDHYVGLTELVVGIRAFQDLGRGLTQLTIEMAANAGEYQQIAAAQDLLPLAVLSADKIDDLASQLDSAIASEPPFGPMLHGDALGSVLYFGIAPMKPRSWQPPGGRADAMPSDEHFHVGDHDFRDGMAPVIASDLDIDDIYASACPDSASMKQCRLALSRAMPPREPTDSTSHVGEIVVKLRLFPGDETRRSVQQDLLAELRNTRSGFIVTYLDERVRTLSRLVGLRLRLEVLRNGRCPTEAELAAPPYSTLRAPAVLGDSVLVTLRDSMLQVDPPEWVDTQISPRPRPPFMIPCPQP